MNKRDLTLAMLACAEGRPYTPVQLQKALFLATRQVPGIINQGPEFNFRPYDYGPFDSDVYTEATHLHMQGDAVVAPSGQGRWNTYSASDRGLVKGREILAQIPESSRRFLIEVSGWVRSQSFSGLVKSIYDAYPEMRANSIFRG